MTAPIQSMLSAHSRVAAIESRLGVRGARGVDTRGSDAGGAQFDALLARFSTTATGGSSAPGASAASATTPALDRLTQRIGGGATLTGVPFADLFRAAGREHGVDPALLAAVAGAESGYDPTAVSRAGAQGLMQLMPGTAAGLGVTDSFDPAQAVDGAARLLAGHLDKYGSVDLALAAYNAGPGAVDRFGGIPPYEETQRYVPAVLTRYQELLR